MEGEREEGREQEREKEILRTNICIASLLFLLVIVLPTHFDCH